MAHNPWANRWRRLGADEPDRNERAMIEYEARQAEQVETRPCDADGCKGTAYYRPGVGGWWCDTCKDADGRAHLVRV